MKKDNKELIIGICFFIFALIIFVATPILCLKFCEKSYAKFMENNELVIVINPNNKIEENEDFIYFIDDYPIINLKSDDAKNVTIELQNYIDSFKSDPKVELDSSACYYCEDSYYFNYGVFETEDYVTLLIQKSKNYCFYDDMDSNEYLAYTFDIKSGKHLSNQDMFEIYNLTFHEVLETIKNELNKEQTIINDIEYIKIEETINELVMQDNHVIYINEYGDLLINYIVKTNFVDYNDISKINR